MSGVRTYGIGKYGRVHTPVFSSQFRTALHPEAKGQRYEQTPKFVYIAGAVSAKVNIFTESNRRISAA